MRAATAEGTTRRVDARRLVDAPLWVHVVLLAVLLVVVQPLLRPGVPWTSDDGAYGLQAEALDDGDWAWSWAGEAADPDLRWFPFVYSTRSGDEVLPYAKHPAWPSVQAPLVGRFGPTVGLLALSLGSVVAAAAVAWGLAAVLVGHGRRAAFWLVAAGPVLVQGQLAWAHAPSAALAGAAALAGIRWAKGEDERWLPLALAAAVAGGVLLRSESLLFAGALAVGLGWLALGAGRARAVAVAGTVVGAAAAARLVEGRWIASLVTSPPVDLAVRAGSGSWLGSRPASLARTVFTEGGPTHEGALVAAITVPLAVVAGLALRRSETRTAVVALAAVAGLVVLRTLAVPDQPVTGLLAAFPVLVVAAAAMPTTWVRGRTAVTATLLSVAGFAGLVAVTQYPEGGGLEWGARFLSPLLVPLAAVAGPALAAAVRHRSARLAVAGVAMASAVVGLTCVSTMRADIAGVEDDLAAAQPAGGVIVTNLTHAPRQLWRTADDVTWFLTDTAELDDAATAAADAGMTGIAVLTVTPPAELPAGIGDQPSVPIGDDGLRLYRLPG